MWVLTWVCLERCIKSLHTSMHGHDFLWSLCMAIPGIYRCYFNLVEWPPLSAFQGSECRRQELALWANRDQCIIAVKWKQSACHNGGIIPRVSVVADYGWDWSAMQYITWNMHKILNHFVLFFIVFSASLLLYESRMFVIMGNMEAQSPGFESLQIVAEAGVWVQYIV